MSIDALNSANSLTQLNAASSSNKLSAETKNKLESFGIDTSKIKTESQGQLRLQELANTQQNQQAQQTQQSSNNANPMDTMIKQAKVLAAEVGAKISNQDDLKTIMTKVYQKLMDMTDQVSNNPQKLQQLEKYSTQFEIISAEYQDFKEQKQAEKAFGESQISGSLNSMAMYNKLFFNLQ